MFLNREEIADRNLNLKGWLARIQLQAKKPDSPEFKIEGPMVLKVRVRRTSRTGAATSTENHSFMGDEPFKLDGIFSERDIVKEGFNLSVTMRPAELGLGKWVASLSMPLAEAMTKFTGLEAWVVGLAAGLEDEPPGRAGVPARPAPPTHDEDPRWGAF